MGFFVLLQQICAINCNWNQVVYLPVNRDSSRFPHSWRSTVLKQDGWLHWTIWDAICAKSWEKGRNFVKKKVLHKYFLYGRAVFEGAPREPWWGQKVIWSLENKPKYFAYIQSFVRGRKVSAKHHPELTIPTVRQDAVGMLRGSERNIIGLPVSSLSSKCHLHPILYLKS